MDANTQVIPSLQIDKKPSNIFEEIELFLKINEFFDNEIEMKIFNLSIEQLMRAFKMLKSYSVEIKMSRIVSRDEYQKEKFGRYRRLFYITNSGLSIDFSIGLYSVSLTKKEVLDAAEKYNLDIEVK